MPELPEVQTIVNDLNKKIIGRKITGVWFDAPKLVKKPKAKELEKQIKGFKINSVKRRGKNVLIYLSGNNLLLVHQKMTGHLLVGKWSIKKVSSLKFKVSSLIKGPLEEKVNNYIHVVFNLDNGQQLALSDLRKFAKIVFGKKEDVESLSELKKLGPDALDKNFTLEKFKNIAKSQNKNIKEVLMEQNLIAGIGNIYSDEILWLAKVYPLKRANSLNARELKAIYGSIKFILKKGLKLRGTSISDYRDTSGKSGFYDKVRYVYRKEGEKCPRGNGIIKRIKIKGRSAHFCPVCQKL